MYSLSATLLISSIRSLLVQLVSPLIKLPKCNHISLSLFKYSCLSLSISSKAMILLW